MPAEEAIRKSEPRRLLRVTLVLLGIALGQFILYGPSLTGRKILLPLDILAGQGFYLPQTPDIVRIRAKDGSVADQVLQFEPARRFAISEFRAGRLPMWAPYEYAGAPFNWPVLSPFLALQSASPSPIVLAWSQLLAALVAGVGAYLFFRRVLAVSFWPATICAWCYPLTGFFVLWQGFPLIQPVCWLPWLLLAVEETVQARHPLSPLGLAVLTCVVANGQLDVAGQVLLVSGVFAVWRLFVVYWKSEPAPAVRSSGAARVPAVLAALLRIPWGARRVALRLAGAWALGLLVATPYVLPVLEYTRTGARMERRGTGTEERPPVGLAALPQVVLPDMYGTRQPPSLRYAGGPTQQEGSGAGYAGALATLLLAPVAFCSRRHRNFNIFWTVLSLFALGWSLNLPGVVALLRLPGLNMMSHNRLVFGAGFAVLALAATGLEVLFQQSFRWRTWMWAALALPAVLSAWCMFRTVRLPEPIATEIGKIVASGRAADWIHDLDGVKRAQAWFVQYYAGAAVWCGIGVLGWVVLRRERFKQSGLAPVLGGLLLGEVLWFAYGRSVQSDPALYYPSIPVLESVAKTPPGRVMGFGCLPATLAAMCGLRDIRGYDGVDPARLVELVLSASEPSSIKPRYAPTMEVAPKATITPEGDIQLPPVLDMLGVRYVIFRGVPFPKTRPLFKGEDYWVLQNPRALPRAYVPKSVEVLTNDATRVAKLESADFNPREVAFVETAINFTNFCRGTAEITDEIPTRVDVSLRMETPGLVVLADLWDKGWRAYLDDKPVPILRANHAVRGVVVPAGSRKLEFRYEPASLALGKTLAGLSVVLLVGWLAIAVWRGNPPPVKHDSPSHASSSKADETALHRI